MSDDKSGSLFGIGAVDLLLVLLTVVFVSAKVFGFLDWSWLAVFIPTIILVCCNASCLVVVLGFVAVVFILNIWKWWK